MPSLLFPSTLMNMRSYGETFREIRSAILSFIFPLTCIGCGKGDELLCDNCLGRIPLCSRTEKEIISVFSYEHPTLRSALWSLKYHNATALAQPLAHALYDRVLEEMEEVQTFHGPSKATLVPIPLHPRRKRQRGYNQSELLCKELSLIDPSSFTLETRVLYRTRDTKSQATIRDRAKRLKNISGCFDTKNEDTIKGAFVIVVDDITTTGATMKEAIRTIRRAGAKKVIGLTVAH